MRKNAILLILAWVPFCLQPAWGQAPGVGKKDTAIKPPSGSAGGKQDGKTDGQGSKERPFVVDTKGHQNTDDEKAEAGEEKEHARYIERRTLFFAGLGSWATFALVIVGALGIIAATWTLISIKRQADLQERSIRPWIGTDFIKDGVIIRSGQNVTAVRANVSLKNTGPSIALDGIMLPFLVSSRTSELPKAIEAAWAKTKEVLANRNSTKWETGFVLHPTRSHTHECIMGASMPFSELTTEPWFVIICIIYRDQFGKEHRTQDCFRVRVTDPHSAYYDAVPAHQKAD